ncbi:MAG: right-handed parallel beta-helix repeat-containing protein, partial [Planctomycetota bacterium]
MRRQILVALLILLGLGGLARATTYYVHGTLGNDAWDGLAPVWDGVHGPKMTIQSAVDVAGASGDDIIVAPGQYPGTVYVHEKEIDIHSALISDPCMTVLDGQLVDSVVTFEDCGPGAILRGFRIINGYAHLGSGGGIACIRSAPTIFRCVIEQNRADFYGGGIDIDGSFSGAEPVITRCWLRDNSGAYGGAISTFWFTSPEISFCEITNNTARDIGSFNIRPVGGGLHCVDSSPVLTNCLITGNRTRLGTIAWGVGGAMYLYEADVEVTNCTIADNVGQDGYGGIYCDSREYRQPTIKNSILWNNGDDLWNCDGLARYSCIEDFDDSGIGNIHSDPLFVGPYYLSFDGGYNVGQEMNSPCIDAGDGNAVDLGLDLYTTQADHAPDTGTVDMGYHKRITPVPEYRLVSVAIGNGAVDPFCPLPAGCSYDQYTIVEVNATPADANHRIQRWVVDGNPVFVIPGDPTSGFYTDNTYTVDMTQDVNMGVIFEERPPRTLMLVVNYGGGRVEALIGPGDQIIEWPRTGAYPYYRDGDVVTILAQPNPGYVTRWSGTDHDNTYREENTVTMNSN